MDFRLPNDYIALREEVTEFFAEHFTEDMREEIRATGTLHDDTLHEAIAKRGWIGACWPRELGGLGIRSADFAAFWEAAHYAGAPVDGLQLTEMVGSVLVRLGTREQKAEFIPRILRGELLIALGYTEPDSGSDVASAKTLAVRVDGGYVINGAKMFTTMAHISDYVFLLARTNPDAPKHQGLSMFLVPLEAPGVEIRPIETFGGERTNSTFYDNVFVPESHRVGEENAGWHVLTTALDVERASIGGYVGQARRLYDDLIDGLYAVDPSRLNDSHVRHRLARANVSIEVAAALADRVYCRITKDEVPSVESAMTKQYVTDVAKNLAHEALDLVGPAALLIHGTAGSVVDGRLEHAFRHTQVGTIYGGSNEIQRNIIAFRKLGLPRS